MKARTSMREQRDLENLLKQEKSTPLEDNETSSEHSSVPIGSEDDVSLSTEAELSILERKKRGLDVYDKKESNLDTVEEAVEDTEMENYGHDVSSSLRHSSKSKVQLNNSLKKSVHAVTLSNSMKKSVRRSGSGGLEGSDRAADSGSDIEEIRQDASNSLRHSSKAKVQLSNSMKKSIRRGDSSEHRSSSRSRSHQNNDMKKSVRRHGSSDGLDSSDQERLSSSMKQRTASTQRTAFSKSAHFT